MYLSSSLLISQYSETEQQSSTLSTRRGLRFFLSRVLTFNSDGNNDADLNPGQLFAPNSQDYFRTVLLGIFPPLLLNFVKNFFLNWKTSSKSYEIILSLFSDFVIHDWFLFLIIFFLAYPQVDSTNYHSNSKLQTEENGVPNVWHIIPKQSYIFGISWSLSEFLISILENISYYQEIPVPAEHLNEVEIVDASSKTGDKPKRAVASVLVSKPGSQSLSKNSSFFSPNSLLSPDHSPDPYSKTHKLSLRNWINLDACTNALKSATLLSSKKQHDDENEDENTALNSNALAAQNVGSLNKESDSSKLSKQNITSTGETEDVLYVDLNNNFMGYDSILNSNKYTDDPTVYKNNGLSTLPQKLSRRFSDWTRTDPGLAAMSNDESVNNVNTNNGQYPTRFFYRIENSKKVWTKLFQCFLIILGDVLAVIGQSLISSIYFIYVPGHEQLFTPFVNYWGAKNIYFFLLTVMVPFTIISFIFHFLIYFWFSLKEEYKLLNKDFDAYFPDISGSGYYDGMSADYMGGQANNLFNQSYEPYDYYQNVINDIQKQQQQQQQQQQQKTGPYENMYMAGNNNASNSNNLRNALQYNANINTKTNNTLLPNSSLDYFLASSGSNNNQMRPLLSSNPYDLFNTHRNLSIATGADMGIGVSENFFKRFLAKLNILQIFKKTLYQWRKKTLKPNVIITASCLYGVVLFTLGVAATITGAYVYFDNL